MKDPDSFLNGQHLEFRCIVDPTQPAVLDEVHRVRLGNDVFFFSSIEARGRFVRDPFQYVPWLSDPVSHERFQPGKKSPHAKREGTTFYFAGPATRSAFAADPNSFAHAKNMMLP